MADALLYDAVRTPFGRYGGALSKCGDASCVVVGGVESMVLGDGSYLGEPLARVVARGTHAVDPDVFDIAPVEAANKALAKAGIEAFAAQSLACLGEWRELEPERVNVRGGAIAIGHPLGASGARILGTLAYELRARGGGYGVAAICIGVGQGLAMVLHA